MKNNNEKSFWGHIPKGLKYVVTITASIITIFIGMNKLGYIGYQDPCKGINCLNGGGCNDGKCICTDDYYGDKCQNKKQKIDPCENVNCLNGGKCIDGKCDCPDGFSGPRCQTRPLEDNEILDGRDERIYRIKKIGQNWWIVDNIKYNAPGSKCIDCENNGRLYTYKMAKIACPAGWGLPETHDFRALISESGSIENAVRIAQIKHTGRYGRTDDQDTFVGVGEFAMFWTNSKGEKGMRHFFFNKLRNIAKPDVQGNDQFYSCRCIKK